LGAAADGLVQHIPGNHEAVSLRSPGHGVLEIAGPVPAHEYPYSAYLGRLGQQGQHAHFLQQPDGRAGKAVATALVARESARLEQQHPTSSAGQVVCRRGSTGTCPNHDDIESIVVVASVSGGG